MYNTYTCFLLICVSSNFIYIQPISAVQSDTKKSIYPYIKIWEDRAAMLKEKESTGDSANYGINLAMKKFTLVGLFGGICPSGCFEIVPERYEKIWLFKI